MFRRIGRHAMEQKPSPRDGLRKTRWFVARSTYPELKRTTIRTWKRVWPSHIYGDVKMGAPPSHTITFGDVRMEVDFLAFDDEDDIQKLRSADYTGGCFHEVQSFAKAAHARIDIQRKRRAAQHGQEFWQTRTHLPLITSLR
jgi:hypothetical protein